MRTILLVAPRLPAVVLVVLLAFGARVTGQATSGAAGLGDAKRLWEVAIEEDGFDLEYKASAVLPGDESVWLVFGRRPSGKSSPQALVLRGLDRAGRTLSETPLDFITRQASFQRPGNEFSDLAAVGDGNLALVFGMGEVVTLNAKSGRVVRSKDLGAGGRFISLRRALSFPDGSLLLVGLGDAGAIAVKLNRALEVVWERTADPSEVSAFTGGVVLEGNSFLLTGSLEHGRAAPFSLWVGRFGVSGQVTKSLSLPGQEISVAAAPGGGCVIVHGARGPLGTHIWFRHYDKDLKELWNVQLDPGLDGRWRPFLLVRVPWIGGEYFVAGIGKDGLLLSRVKEDSSIVRTSTFREQSNGEPELALNVGLQPTSHSVIIPFTAMVMRSSRTRDIVKIMSVDFGD